MWVFLISDTKPLCVQHLPGFSSAVSAAPPNTVGILAMTRETVNLKLTAGCRGMISKVLCL